MSTHKHIDIICLAAGFLSLTLCCFVMSCQATGLQTGETAMGYETRLFDTSRVHTIDITMDDWDIFLDKAQSEEYSLCRLVIDGEAISNAAIRCKGNTSLSSVASMDSERYSFKIEFDHYDSGKNYHGLDKLCLNNLIQDTTYMKDYLSYQLMLEFGAAAPLCSYVYVTVNGEDWGLYLAVEAIEESFLTRNYGSSYGQLYKPDGVNMGGFGGMGSSDAKLQYIDDDPDSYSTIFDSAKTDITQQDKARLIESLKALSQGSVEECLDIEQVLRYFVVHNFVVNGDSYTGSMVHNYYLYEENGLLAMLPWDYNLAFGTFQSKDSNSAVNDGIDSPLSVTGDGSRPMADWIFQSDEYTQLYHQYFAEFLDTVDCQAIIDQTKALISGYVEQDPTAFYTYDQFESGVATLKEFCQLRQESLSHQLAGDGETVDASHLELSSMGSMNTGGEMPFPGDDDTASFAEMSPPEAGNMPEMPENFEDRTPPGNMPDFEGFEGFVGPENQQSSPDSADAAAAAWLLGISGLFLAVGLAIAFKFKR